MTRYRFTLALLVLALMGCGPNDCPSSRSPTEAELARYAELQECTGVSAPPSAVATVPGVWCRDQWCVRVLPDGFRVFAEFHPSCDTIVMPAERPDPYDVYDDEALHRLACAEEADCDLDHSLPWFQGRDRGGCL